MEIARLPNLLIVILSVIGTYYAARSMLLNRARVARVHTIAHLFTVCAFVINLVLHVGRIAGYTAPNAYFLLAAVIAVSALTMHVIADGGRYGN